MKRRSNDGHLSGRWAVALAPIAIPFALLRQLLPLKKTQDRTPGEVAGFLSDFIEGRGGDWDWDDFTSAPITAPELEAIRVEAEMIPLPIDAAGYSKLEQLLTRAYELRAAAIKEPNSK